MTRDAETVVRDITNGTERVFPRGQKNRAKAYRYFVTLIQIGNEAEAMTRFGAERVPTWTMVATTNRDNDEIWQSVKRGITPE